MLLNLVDEIGVWMGFSDAALILISLTPLNFKADREKARSGAVGYALPDGGFTTRFAHRGVY